MKYKSSLRCLLSGHDTSKPVDVIIAYDLKEKPYYLIQQGCKRCDWFDRFWHDGHRFEAAMRKEHEDPKR